MYRRAEATNLMERLGERIANFFVSVWGRLYESPMFWIFIAVQILCVGTWGLSLVSRSVPSLTLFSVGPYERLWVPMEEPYRFSSCGGFTVTSAEGAPVYKAEEEEEIPLESNCKTKYVTLDETLSRGYWIFSSELITTEFSYASHVILAKRPQESEILAQIEPRPERRLLRWMVFALWGIPIALVVRGIFRLGGRIA